MGGQSGQQVRFGVVLLAVAAFASGAVPRCGPTPLAVDDAGGAADVPVVEELSCGGLPCPSLEGYTVACNTADHCEYANATTTGWRRFDVWIWVPPTRFRMGPPEGEPGAQTPEQPAHDVTLAEGFFLARYELTTAQHEACEAAGACTPPATDDWDGGGWGRNRIANGRGNHPQNGLTQREAEAACAWLAPGGRLPSEAEWERAASGPTHRAWPWGDGAAPTCADGRAVFAEGGPGCGTGGTRPVGSLPDGASAVGADDMAGNVWEWTADCWHCYYWEAPADGSAWLAACAEPDKAVKRGGAFHMTNPYTLRVSARDFGIVTDRHAGHGVRCVR